MNRPEDLDLSREDGDALIERLETEIWTAEDRQVLIQVVRLYFCLLFALKETQLSLNRFRIMLFGEKAKLRKPSSEASLDAEPQGGAMAFRLRAPHATPPKHPVKIMERLQSQWVRRPLKKNPPARPTPTTQSPAAVTAASAPKPTPGLNVLNAAIRSSPQGIGARCAASAGSLAAIR